MRAASALTPATPPPAKEVLRFNPGEPDADADANFVLIEGGQIAEVQATAEGATYDEEGLLRLLRLARMGTDRIFAAQAEAVK